MTGKSISRIILFVKDMKVVRDFYEVKLRLPVINVESPEFITLHAGGCQLCLHQIPAEYAGDSIEPREDSYTKMVFESDDVEKDREELVNLGIRMKEMQRWNGMFFCDGADPEGNIFQISSRIK